MVNHKCNNNNNRIINNSNNNNNIILKLMVVDLCHNLANLDKPHQLHKILQINQ